MPLNKRRDELPWLYYPKANRVIINAHNFSTYDPDAQIYISAVEAADAASLATKYKDAINDFVVAAKSDGFWNAIKAACLLAGPASLDGALVPLVGAAPTKNNFVSGDYNRATGLKGDTTTKSLNSNRNNNTDPQNSRHLTVYITETSDKSVARGHIGVGLGDTGASNITHGSLDGAGVSFRASTATAITIAPDNRSGLGMWGVSRSSSTAVAVRYKQSTGNHTVTSETPFNGDVYIFWRNAGNRSDARMSWYSIGEHLDLSLLESRLATYMAAIA